MPKINPAQFVREVRQEAVKVTWPLKKEVALTTVMVFIFVFLASIFFLLVDQVVSFGIRSLLGFGG